MTDATASQNCPYCNSPLPNDAPKGFCPRCLLELFGSQAHEHDNVGSTKRESPDSAARSAIDQVSSFGGYELLGQIAEGGMGVVYLARHKRFSRTITLAADEGVERFPISAAKLCQRLLGLGIGRLSGE